jgi:hypothetical protein
VSVPVADAEVSGPTGRGAWEIIRKLTRGLEQSHARLTPRGGFAQLVDLSDRAGPALDPRGGIDRPIGRRASASTELAVRGVDSRRSKAPLATVKRATHRRKAPSSALPVQQLLGSELCHGDPPRGTGATRVDAVVDDDDMGFLWRQSILEYDRGWVPSRSCSRLLALRGSLGLGKRGGRSTSTLDLTSKLPFAKSAVRRVVDRHGESCGAPTAFGRVKWRDLAERGRPSSPLQRPVFGATPPLDHCRRHGVALGRVEDAPGHSVATTACGPNCSLARNLDGHSFSGDAARDRSPMVGLVPWWFSRADVVNRSSPTEWGLARPRPTNLEPVTTLFRASHGRGRESGELSPSRRRRGLPVAGAWWPLRRVHARRRDRPEPRA